MEGKKLKIYTDGACSYNPGPGGWAAILIFGDVEKRISGGCAETTNNRMELTAAIEALHALKRPCSLELYTDSAYLCNGFTQGWVFNWQRNGWRKSNKDEVLNPDLWTELLRLNSIHDITWIKVKGHSDNEYNNACDKMARAEIDRFKKK